MKVKTKKARRTRVRLRQRQRIRGTAERPRLAVSRSLEHISAQVIDDQIGRTIASASSVEPALKVLLQNGARGGNTAGARVVGKAVAERGIALGVKQVGFCITAASVTWRRQHVKRGWSSELCVSDDRKSIRRCSI